MAQLNITLNQGEILQLLSEKSGEAFKKLLTESLNAILQAESSDQLQADRYERSDERLDSRNGTRERPLTTRIGKIILNVPRHRNQPFKTLIFENYSRSEAGLVATMAEMVVNGVSTRKVSKVMETLCGETFSKSTVSEACKMLDKTVKEFRERDLKDDYPFVILDATYLKVRENNRVISKALMIAHATNNKGKNEVIGFGVYPNESIETWSEFVKSLKKRGLTGVLMFVSDAHEGIRKALIKEFPNVPWQRCQFHFSKNITEKAPKKYQEGIRMELQELFNSRTIEDARKKRDEIISSYRDVAEGAMNCLDEGFESCMTVMTLPVVLHKFYRTSNHIERLNREIKRRAKVIGIFSNDDSILRLMGTYLIERSDQMQCGRSAFTEATYAKLIESDTPKKLLKIAMEQVQLSEAA